MASLFDDCLELLLTLCLLLSLYTVTQMKELLVEASTTQVDAMKWSIGRQLVTAGLGLASETTQPLECGTPSKPPASQKETTSPTSPNTVASPSRNEQDDDGRALRPNISNRYNPRSFRGVYEEFHGIGEYDSIPIVGGFAEMDRKYKTKWRLGDAGYQRAFSRMQQICKAMEIEVANGKTLDGVVEELDRLFEDNDCKGGLEKMRGLVSPILPKKNRKGRLAGQGAHQLGVV